MRSTFLGLDDTQLTLTLIVSNLQLSSLTVLNKYGSSWSRAGFVLSVRPDPSLSQMCTVGVRAWGWCSWNLPKQGLLDYLMHLMSSVSSLWPHSWRAWPSPAVTFTHTLHEQNGLIFCYISWCGGKILLLLWNVTLQLADASHCKQ